MLIFFLNIGFIFCLLIKGNFRLNFLVIKFRLKLIFKFVELLNKVLKLIDVFIFREFFILLGMVKEILFLILKLIIVLFFNFNIVGNLLVKEKFWNIDKVIVVFIFKRL